MTVKHFTSLAAAGRAIAKDAKARDRRVRRTVRMVAARVRDQVARKYVPIAFRELIDSLHVLDAQNGTAFVIADAPHSEAVENGSRPHTPPLEPLVRWVQLRGMQGLTRGGGVRSMYGKGRRVPSTGPGRPKAPTPGRERQIWRMQASRVIATSLQQRLGRTGAASWLANARAVSAGKASYVTKGPGNMGNVDPDTLAVARAIQGLIKKRGTKPARYMAQGAAEANGYFDILVRRALPDPAGDMSSGGDDSGAGGG